MNANTVRIYKVTLLNARQMSECGTWYSLNPWGGDVGEYVGCDDGGCDYTLPDGFELARDYIGLPMIFSPDGEGCNIERFGNHPVLETGKGIWHLKKVRR